jgi:hypothetical protein
MVEKNIIEFNEDNFKQELRRYVTYRKCFGLLTANMCYLPIVKSGFVVSGDFDEQIIPYLKNKYGNIIMCRTDAPFNAWQNISRGRDIEIEDIREHYINMYNSVSTQIVLLCFQHPAVYFTGEFIERWAISGGATVLIIWGEQIIIEYVGKGFDVGDLTRGVNLPHQRFSIPWSIRNNDFDRIWELMCVECIKKNDYTLSRKSRIGAMQKMGYEQKTVETNIPQVFTPIQSDIFQDLYNKCVRPVLNKKSLFLEENSITILVNIYENAFHVFEIWESSN